MQIKVINVAKVRESFVLEGEREYLKRLPKQFRVSCTDLGVGGNSSRSDDESKRLGSELFVSKVKAEDLVVLLDERGSQLSSIAFADQLAKWGEQCRGEIVFGIGGPHGWDQSARKRAAYVLSFGTLTFPHQIARLLLVEQLYRAYTLQRGIGYHKE